MASGRNVIITGSKEYNNEWTFFFLPRSGKSTLADGEDHVSVYRNTD